MRQVLAIIAIGALLALSLLLNVTPAHVAEYRALMVDSVATPTHTYRTQQERKENKKQLFFMKDGKRLQFTLTSARGEMLLNRTEHDAEVLEQLYDIHGSLQDEFTFEAKKGLYDYRSNRFVADDVQIVHQKMRGTADKMELSSQSELQLRGHVHYEDELRSLQANAVTLLLDHNRKPQEIIAEGDLLIKQGDEWHVTAARGRYFPEKQLWCLQEQVLVKHGEDEIFAKEELRITYGDKLTFIEGQGFMRIKKATHTLTADGTLFVDHEKGYLRLQDHILFQDLKGEIRGDTLTLNYNGFLPDKLTMTGHVQMRNQFGTEEKALQYAIADKVEYFPSENRMLLSANPGERVLLFDEINQIQASAPALSMRRHAVTKKESLQGIGDVRFLLLKGEQEKLRSIFSLPR